MLLQAHSENFAVPPGKELKSLFCFLSEQPAKNFQQSLKQLKENKERIQKDHIATGIKPHACPVRLDFELNFERIALTVRVFVGKMLGAFAQSCNHRQQCLTHKNDYQQGLAGLW